MKTDKKRHHFTLLKTYCFTNNILKCYVNPIKMDGKIIYYKDRYQINKHINWNKTLFLLKGME
jgi:hypothetical protein